MVFYFLKKFASEKIFYILFVCVNFFFFLVAINIFSYAVMWVDKVKSIYQKWRVSEKTLWTLAIFGGVFGVWLGMQAPIYHKA